MRITDNLVKSRGTLPISVEVFVAVEVVGAATLLVITMWVILAKMFSNLTVAILFAICLKL